MRVLVTGARAPVALHVAGLLSEAGCQVDAADTFDVPLLEGSPYISRQILHPSPVFDRKGFAAWCEEIAGVYDLIVPTCEETFHLSLYINQDTLFAPDHITALMLHSKAKAMRFMARLRIDHPRTLHVPEGGKHTQWELPASETVIKREFSRFGSSTIIGPKKIELAPDTSWVLQEKLSGIEVCVTAILRSGKVYGCVAYEIPYKAGQQGAGIFFDPLRRDDPRRQILEEMTDKIGQATNYTGILSFDSIVVEGRPHIIEINPRATSGLHFFRNGQAFQSAMMGEANCSARQRPQMLGLAMALYHPIGRLLPGRMREDIKIAEEATSYNKIGPGPMRQIRTVLRLYRMARAKGAGTSLLGASTFDIAWNGWKR